MLTLHSIASPREQREIFKSFDPMKETWVVSDLKTKLDLNRSLLEGRSFLPGEAVQRASELWKLLLSRLRPDLQFVSKEFIVTLIGHKLAASEYAWAKAPGAAQAAYDYMTQLMPVLSHPNGEEMMTEWLSQNPGSDSRWGRWFRLSVELWNAFLEDGFVATPWTSGVLSNEIDLKHVWSRSLIVDLGADLDQVEADLLVQMSQFIDVAVIVPDPSWASEYKKSLLAYEIFARKLKVEKKRSERALGGEARTPQYRKYTTMIAEVKDAVAQAREWLESSKRESGSGESGDLTPKKIAIAAPDIECYWPALSGYLEQEGIPCQKDHVRRLHSYPDIVRWLAYLRLKTGAFAEADVELALFDSQDATPRLITYERFKTLYSSLYGREDIERSKEVATKFSIELKTTDEASRDDFVSWSLKQLPEKVELQRVESIYKKLFAECPETLRLSLRRWLAYLEQLASKVECRIKDGDPDGIACINLSSAENSPSTHMIVLGLTESALKPSGGTAILYSDIMSIADEFGFHLASEDQSCLEFEARWVIEDGVRELLLCVPETDFAGAAQAPSWIWVRGAREAQTHHLLSLPRTTRWDQLQKSSLARIAKEKGWPVRQAEFLEQALKEDLGEAALDPFGGGLIQTLSPSAIEDYLDCPFIFAAKRIFMLSDVAELDLEVDASRRGSLMHKLFEILTTEPVRVDLSDDEIGLAVEKARELSRLELADERLWLSLKARHVDLAKRFLSFEADLRRNFPQTKTVGREADLAGYINVETGELLRDPEPHHETMRFVGRIDRIDTDDEGHLAIYDYKSSAASVSQYGSWLKNNNIQLLLYAMAVEKGLTILKPNPVAAALYYVSKPLMRDHGYKVEDLSQGLYDTANKRLRNRLTQAEKENLFAQGTEVTKHAIDGIREGRFRPEPRDPQSCKDCQWSPVCRAPHLNT